MIMEEILSLLYVRPLVFGHAPYALSILGSIADRTTVKNGLPQKFARRQLLQQLSVTLWRYNAKMILRQYSLTADHEDEFPDFDIG